MRSLVQALQEHELVVLRVIGEWWEIDLTGKDKKASIDVLSEALPHLDIAQELIYLPALEADAMRDIIRLGGRMPIATFKRKYGEIREMGPAALAREEPWFDPVSAAEDLWYRGFIYKGFDEGGDGMVEFAFVPLEFSEQFDVRDIGPDPNEELPGQADSGQDMTEPPLLDDFPPTPVVSTPIPPTAPLSSTSAAASISRGQRAGPVRLVPVERPDPEIIIDERLDAVDDLATILALAQTGRLRVGESQQLTPFLYDTDQDRVEMLTTLGVEMSVVRQVDEGFRPTRAAVPWLKNARETQLRSMAEAWSRSAWNELRHMPSIQCEGSGWSNDPAMARNALLDGLTLTDQWYRFSELVALVKDQNPDFQRPNGNYDTWYIRDVHTGEYLNGFDNWGKVEGRLLVYLIKNPMSWLGLAEHTADRYRLTARGIAWLKGDSISVNETTIPLVIKGNGQIVVPHNADRYQRFQVSRIADMLPATPEKPFTYRITPRSLEAAREQGIAPKRVLDFLGQASGRPIPASIKRAIERWAENGTEGRVDQLVVLRVADAEILTKLRQHPKTRPLIGESLGDLTAVVMADNWGLLCQNAAELGLLLTPPE